MTEWLSGYFYHPCARSEFPLHSYLDPCLLYYPVLPHPAGSIWRTHSSSSSSSASAERWAAAGAGLPCKQGDTLIWCAENILFSGLGRTLPTKPQQVDQETCRSYESLCICQPLSLGCVRLLYKLRNVFLQPIVFRVAKPRVKVFGRHRHLQHI